MRRILAELPETLDATYERILQEIPKTNRVYTRRLLQCLTVAVRPLEVEELAEVLAIDFDAEGGTPKLYEGLRWADQEQAVLSACSSLVAIVEVGNSRRVQFSHYSVKEYLTSDRLATSDADVLRGYHILLEPAHVIMAKACLGVLLRLDDHMDEKTIESYPLAEYAGNRFVDHAKFEDVLSHINDGLDDLLDPDKPHFNTWIWLLDGDWEVDDRSQLYSISDSSSSSGSDSGSSSGSGSNSESDLGDQSNVQPPVPKYPPRASPLYCLLGVEYSFLAERYILKRPRDLDADDIYGMTSLHIVMAVAEFWPRCYKLAQMLIERTSDINGRDKEGWTPLHHAMHNEDHDAHHDFLHCIRLLLDRGADVEAQSNNGSTPLHLAASRMGQEAIQLLIKNAINIDLRNNKGQTALHKASKRGHLDIVQLLLDHGADLNLQDNHGSTPFHLATHHGRQEVVQLFLKHGAKVNLRNDKGQTALHQASQHGHLDIIQLLLKHDADVDALDNDGSTLLHLAISACDADWKTVEWLLNNGANTNLQNSMGQTALHRASEHGRPAIIQLILKHIADVDARDNNGSTSLHLAISEASLKAVELLLDHGASVTLQNDKGQAALHRASQRGRPDIIKLLLNHNADVDALDNEGSTPLHLAISEARLDAVELLLDHGASVHVQNNRDETSFDIASARGLEEITRLLLMQLPIDFDWAN